MTKSMLHTHQHKEIYPYVLQCIESLKIIEIN